MCDGGVTDSSLGDVIADTYATPESITTSDCVDTSLLQATVFRQEDRSSLSEAMPLLWAFQVAELPEFPAPTCGLFDVSTHVFSPDSAETLARTTILLI